ncbi:MAG: hypothetical protein ND895_20775 [Pyrinomonadaceae bacterium]|nr:hypothetical protein [Pyrinomonadaceae bacterium]
MRISNMRVGWLKIELPSVGFWMTGIGSAVASVALICSALVCLSSAYGQEAPEQEIQSPEKAHAQVCPDPPPQTSGSHLFRRLGETLDIPISIADCQPVALVLHWSNGRNNGSLLNVTFLDSSNQPISSSTVSVFQHGTIEMPFASLAPQPWFAAGAVVAVPTTVVIQTVQPFANPAGISYRVTRAGARVRPKSRAEVQLAALTKSQPVASRLPVLDDQVAMKLRTAEGRLLSQGQGSWASGAGEPVRYRLKELRLPEPREIEKHGRREIIEFAYRLTLAGAESRKGVQVPALSRFGLIWLDDAALPTFSLDSQEVSTLIYDRSVLKDGAQISVSNSDGSDMYSLAEPLKYPSSVQGQTSQVETNSEPKAPTATASIRTASEREEGNEVVSIKSVVRVIGATRMPLVQIELRTSRPFPPRESALQLQIGKRFFLNELTGDHTGHTLTLTLTQEMFAALKEGAAIVAFFDKPDRSGFAGRGGWHFGRLQKGRLQN